MARRQKSAPRLDTELVDLPPDARWREWMGRVEAVVFASPEPVGRTILASLVGRDCNLDLLIQDIRRELQARPYDLVPVAGGWQHRTRPVYAKAIRAARVVAEHSPPLSELEGVVLITIAYFQPVTRAEVGAILGMDISRETIGRLRAEDLIAPGPRSPHPGAPYTFVTTATFLSRWGLDSLQDLPDQERLRDAGLLSKEDPLGAVGAPVGRDDGDTGPLG